LSASSFELDAVQGNDLPSDGSVQAIRFNSAIGTGSILEVLPNSSIRDSDKVYIAIGLYDTFDKQRESDDPSFGEANLRKSIKINGITGGNTASPTYSVLEVQKSADISESIGQGFKHWIRLNLDGSWYGQGIQRVVELDPDDTHADSDVATHPRYQPWTYKNYIGFRGYACSFIHTSLSLSEGLTVQFENVMGGDEGEWLNYLQNFFCGVVYTEFDEALTMYIFKMRETHPDLPEATTPYEIIQLYGYPVNEDLSGYQYPGGGAGPSSFTARMKGGSRTQKKFGFKRYRVFFDPQNKPVDDNYAVMGVCTDNEPYIPYLPSVSTTPEGRMPVFQSDWDSNVYADWAGIIEVMYGYNLANTPYMGDIPGQIKHHPAGFGQGFGGLLKKETYFDVHMGWLIDASYLTDAFFAVIETSAGANTMTAKEDW